MAACLQWKQCGQVLSTDYLVHKEEMDLIVVKRMGEMLSQHVGKKVEEEGCPLVLSVVGCTGCCCPWWWKGEK